MIRFRFSNKSRSSASHKLPYMFFLFLPTLSFFVVANGVVAAYLLLVALPLAIVHLIKKHQNTKSRIILVALDTVSITCNIRTNDNFLVRNSSHSQWFDSGNAGSPDSRSSSSHLHGLPSAQRQLQDKLAGNMSSIQLLLWAHFRIACWLLHRNAYAYPHHHLVRISHLPPPLKV